MNPVHPGFQLPGEPGAVIYDYPEGFNLTNATEAAEAASSSSSQAAAASSGGAASASSTTVNYLRTTPAPNVRDINHRRCPRNPDKPFGVVPNSKTSLIPQPVSESENANSESTLAPYVINNIQGDLAVHAVSPNATHHDGTLEYDVHVCTSLIQPS